MKVSTVLYRAAKRIERYGWHQGGYFAGSVIPPDGLITWEHIKKNNPPCCAEGAIDAEGAPDPIPARLAVRKMIESSIFYWNDTPGRTAEEVISTLRATARAEREAGR